MTPTPARLRIEAWNGPKSIPVTVLGVMGDSYRVRVPPEASQTVKVAGKRRSLPPGGTVHVPKAAVIFERKD